MSQATVLKKLIKDGIKNSEFFSLVDYDGSKWVSDGTWALRVEDESVLPAEVRLAGIGSYPRCKFNELSEDKRHDPPKFDNVIPTEKGKPCPFLKRKDQRLIVCGNGLGDIYILDREKDSGLRRLPVDSIEEIYPDGEWVDFSDRASSYWIENRVMAVLMPCRF